MMTRIPPATPPTFLVTLTVEEVCILRGLNWCVCQDAHKENFVNLIGIRHPCASDGPAETLPYRNFLSRFWQASNAFIGDLK